MSRKKYSVDFDNENILTDIDIEDDIANDVDEAENIDSQIDNTNESLTPDYMIKTCKITKRISHDKAIINFDGCGLIVNITGKPDITDSVDIKYFGKIGTPDFKYGVV